MRFEVLGPVRIVDAAGATVRVSVQRLRLLAVLLARANRATDRSLLVEALWDDERPAQPEKSLQLHLHRLRRSLDRPDRIASTPSGYLLEVGADELDAVRFDATHAQAREAVAAGDLDAAVAMFRAALELWRGAPYERIDESSVVAAEASRLAEARLIALEELYEAELARGRAREVVPELTALVAEYPLRERIAGHLMVALVRSGRKARALATYKQLRRRMAAELGSEPGRELRELYDAVAAEDVRLTEQEPTRAAASRDPSSPAPVPSQLPPLSGALVGRDAELAALTRLVEDGEVAAPIVLTGMAGVGKTSLAVHFGRLMTERFPDGQLYVDLRGHSAEPPVPPLQALEYLMRGLGAGADWMAGSLDATMAEFRSRMAGRRVLVVLDNAASSEQVRPMLATSEGSLILITSRNRLSGLVASEGARRIALDALSLEQSREILVGLIGSDRAAVEATAIDELSQACGRLPLALRIAGTQVADLPGRSIGEHAAELTALGHRALSLDGDIRSSVGPAYDASYLRLDASAQRLLRLLGLIPGPDFTAEAAAALADIPLADAKQTLDRLYHAHLLEARPGGRFRFHDLVRDYCRHRADLEESAEDRLAALLRLYSWYYRATEALSAVLRSNRRDLPRPELVETIAPPEFRDAADGAAWLRAECPAIAAAIRQAGAVGTYWSCHLALGIGVPAARRGFLTEMRSALESAVDAARASGDAKLVAHVLTEFNAVRVIAGITLSNHDLTEAVTQATNARDNRLLAYCLYVVGFEQARQDRFDEAHASLTRGLSIQQGLGDDDASECMILNNLGIISLLRGDLRQAERWWRRMADMGTESSQAGLINLSLVLRMLGHFDEVGRILDQLEARLGGILTDDRTPTLSVLLNSRAQWHRELGQFEQALELATAAKQLADDLGTPRHRCESGVTLGFCHLITGDLTTADAVLGEVVQVARSASIRAERAEASRGRAEVALERAAQGGAQEHALLAEAHEHARAALTAAGDENPLVRGMALVTLAHVDIASDRPQEGITNAEQGLALLGETGHILSVGAAHEALAAAYDALGEEQNAKHHRLLAERQIDACGAFRGQALRRLTHV